MTFSKVKEKIEDKGIFWKMIKTLKIIGLSLVLIVIFFATFFFEIGSGANLVMAILFGLGATIAGLFLLLLLAPFFSSWIAFLWFLINLASFSLFLVAAFSQWNQAVAWNKQTTGFYLIMTVIGAYSVFYLVYAFILLKAFLTTMLDFFKRK